jgi:hypothetical protein
MRCFSTIITPDYLPFAESLFHSLKTQGENPELQILIIGKEKIDVPKREGMHFTYLEGPAGQDRFAEALKVHGNSKEALRWHLKPVFLLDLLKNYDQVIYLDPDLYFFGEYDFLFEELNNHSVLLTPHWARSEPNGDEEKFLMNFEIGLFNAGFIGATKKSLSILTWWERACRYKMTKDPLIGLFDDQRYLDRSILDENGGILQHRGCNIGSWNILSCPRAIRKGKVLINETFPLVFIHFNQETIKHILLGDDPLLGPSFEEYEQQFEKTGYRLDQYIPDLEKWKSNNIVLKIKRKISLRTRVKKLLNNLGERL